MAERKVLTSNLELMHINHILLALNKEEPERKKPESQNWIRIQKFPGEFPVDPHSVMVAGRF